MMQLSGKIQTIERIDGGGYDIVVAGTHAFTEAKVGKNFEKGDWVNIRAEYSGSDNQLAIESIEKTEGINYTPKEK